MLNGNDDIEEPGHNRCDNHWCFKTQGQYPPCFFALIGVMFVCLLVYGVYNDHVNAPILLAEKAQREEEAIQQAKECALYNENLTRENEILDAFIQSNAPNTDPAFKIIIERLKAMRQSRWCGP